MQEKKYSPEVQRILDHFLKKFGGRILLDAEETAVVLDTTPGNLAVLRSKKAGVPFLRIRRSVKYNLFVLVDAIEESMAREVA